MKTITFFTLALLLFGCQATNPTPSPNAIMHTVKLETSGSSQYDIKYYNETQSYCDNVNHNGNWTYQFQTKGKIWLMVGAERSNNSPLGLYECKIYIDGVLWKNASGNSASAIQDYYVP
jgi:hypothetical protein